MKLFAVSAFVMLLVMIRNSDSAAFLNDNCDDENGVSHDVGVEFNFGCLTCTCYQNSVGNLYSSCYSDPRPTSVSDYCHVVESNCAYTVEPKEENETRECEIFGWVGK